MAYPATSALWGELLRCRDAEVRDWSKGLRDSLEKPFAQIPVFTLDPFAALRKLVASLPRDWAGIAAETDRLARAGKKLPPDLATASTPTGRLAELCKAARLDYVAIATEADALTRSGKAVPPDLKPIAADAVKRVNCRDAVQRALESGDPRAVKPVFQKALLDGWVERRLITEAETAIAQVDVLDRLKKAAGLPGDGRALVKLWAIEGYKVAGIAEANAYQRDAAQWGARIDAAEAFLRLYSANATEQQLAAAWERVAAAVAHPEIKPEHRTRGEQAARRAPVLAKLAAIPAPATFENDSALLAAWKDDGTLAGCKEADRYVSRVNAARDRVNKVEALKRAIEAADAGKGTEAAVVAAARILGNYPHPY
ncbi:MAG TPA: hypothetical protein VLM40_22130, partial [Gemmata sp.]|nr:hypothetical protein [Gemmata sp.]